MIELLLYYGFLSCLGLFLMFITWFIVFADADLTLTLYEKFGKEPDYSGKVVWITGASSGIGEYLAYDFARYGAKLVLSGTNMANLEKVKSNCIDQRGCLEKDVLIMQFKMEDFPIHEQCVQQVLQHFGQIDVLVNNAGYSQRANFTDIEIDLDINLFSVNVFGAVNLTRKVLPHFFERKSGQVLVTSSLAGKLGAPFSSSYTGSKHALNGYFEALRSETINDNISICIACPGPIFSNITSRCATGKVGQIFSEEQQSTDKRMETKRCSLLMVIALANRLSECWICLQPLLAVYYLAQYTPSFFKSVVLKLFNPERIKALRRGR